MSNGEERARILCTLVADVRNAASEIGTVAKKVIEQGKRIFNLHEEDTLNKNRITSLEETVFGDKKKGIAGLVDRTVKVEKRIYLITAFIVGTLEFGPKGLKFVIDMFSG